MIPFVSVIIPSFNRRTRLKTAIASVLAQTYTDYELIVVDDGSDDGTEAETLFSRIDRPCRCIRCEVNGGVSRARNTGAANAAGTWLAFLDSDDEWRRQKLEKQVAWISRHPSFRIVQTRETWIRRGRRVNPPATHIKQEGDMFGQSLERCMITPSSVMLQKTLFLEIGGFNESLPACEDYDLWLRITCRYPVGLVDEELLIRYGGHDDQLSSTVFALDRFRVRSLLDLVAYAPLTAAQYKLACGELVRKSLILANGYQKHGKVVEYERYKKIAEQYTQTPGCTCE